MSERGKLCKSRDEALIYEAKILARLQIKRKGLRRELREVNRQVRVTVANLKQLTKVDAAPAEWTESGAESKVFG